MTREECHALIDELWALVNEGPNASRKPWAMARVREISEEFQRASMDTYVNEKRRDVLEFFEIWYSPRRWQKWGKDGNRCRSIVQECIHKLKGAMDSLEMRNEALAGAQRPSQ